jgi:hypothetical protein
MLRGLMPKHAKAAPNWTSKTAPKPAYTPVQLKGALVNGFMEEYARSGDACWKILAKENPEGFLRLGAYLAPKEMQLDVFMSNTSDAEIDAMIEVLREKVIEAKVNPPMKLIDAKPEKAPRDVG